MSEDKTGHSFYHVGNVGAVVLNRSISEKNDVPADNGVPGEESDNYFIPWGANNQRPFDLYNKGKKSPIIRSGLNKKARIIYGGGVELVKKVKNETTGKVEFEVVDSEEGKLFEDFKLQSNLENYLIGSLLDLEWFKNVFPQITTNIGGNKVVALRRQKAAYCRWAPRDKEGDLKECFISYKFKSEEPDKKDVLTRKVIDPFSDPVASLTQLAKSKGGHFIFPLEYPGLVENYYPDPEWASVIESGWLDLSLKIADFKNNLMLNQISILYHIEIDDRFWKLQFPKWEDLSVDVKKKKRDEVIEAFLKAKIGTGNAGGVHLTSMLSEQTEKGMEQTSLWKITVLDNKLKDGVYVEDSQEASAHTFAGIGLDPTITGVLPGKGQMPSSGSDKRVAVNIEASYQKVHQDLILKPLYLIKKFNDWPKEWEWRFKTPEITKLDEGTETTQAI